MEYSARELTKKLYFFNISASLKKSLNNFYRTVKQGIKSVHEWKKKIGAGITIIYEGVLAKYLYDLYNVLSDLTVQSQVGRGELPVSPVFAELFPWPKLKITAITDPHNPTFLISRPMSGMEHAVKFFYDNPVLQGLAIAAPFILLGVYYGIKKYRWK